ncbi:MAG: response regulator transcription factor [Spirochaetota bacterium]
MRGRVLIIEDEREVGELIEVYLQREGIETKLVETAEDGLDAFATDMYDLVVLDINLPGIDGFQFLQRIRKNQNLPVIIVSARNTDEDMVLGLGIGADEFVTKPFSPKVLAARVRAHLRRYFQSSRTEKKSYRFGKYRVDLEGHILEKNGERVSLPPKEFAVLQLLISTPGAAMTPEQIYQQVWGQQYGDVATVAIHVQRLRKKIEDDPSHPRFIETIKGFGYRFNPGALEN